MATRKRKATVIECTCDVCGYVWTKPVEEPLPVQCIRNGCRSRAWNRPPLPKGAAPTKLPAPRPLRVKEVEV